MRGGEWKRLRDGEWGATVPDDVDEGDPVELTTAEGRVTIRRVEEIVGSFPGHWIVTLLPKEDR